MISAVADAHPELAFDFVVAHLDAVMSRIESSSQTRYVPRLLGGAGDLELIDKLNAYAQAHIAADARGAVNNTVAAIRFRAEVVEKRGPEVAAWLKARRS